MLNNYRMEAETFKSHVNIELSRLKLALEDETRLRLDFEYKIN
jgi:hypothetical protein